MKKGRGKSKTYIERVHEEFKIYLDDYRNSLIREMKKDIPKTEASRRLARELRKKKLFTAI